VSGACLFFRGSAYHTSAGGGTGNKPPKGTSFLVYFETSSPYVARDGLEPSILLLSSKCWDPRLALSPQMSFALH
jgi:hypothetical protein